MCRFCRDFQLGLLLVSALPQLKRRSMSSENRKLVFLLPMLSSPACSSRASVIIRSRKMLKRVGERRHPRPYSNCCFEPYSCVAVHLTIALSQSCSMVRTRFALLLYFRMVAHKATCYTLSKAFLKSVKTWNKFC